MSPAHHSQRPAVNQFRTFVASLARDIGAELELAGGIAALLDTQHSLWAAVELSEAENCTFVVLPFMAMPTEDAAATALATKILGLNAVRAAMVDTCFGSDLQRGTYCLVRKVDLDLQPADFVRAVHELMDLGQLVRTTMEEEGVVYIDEAPLAETTPPLLARD